MNPFSAIYDSVFGTIAGAMNAQANRESIRAKMAALKLERDWNIKVMKQNAADIYAKNVLSAYGSGINPNTGSTQAIINNNQGVLRDEISFREGQYGIELRNLEAQSKQRYLGLF